MVYAFLLRAVLVKKKSALVYFKMFLFCLPCQKNKDFFVWFGLVFDIYYENWFEFLEIKLTKAWEGAL